MGWKGLVAAALAAFSLSGSGVWAQEDEGQGPGAPPTSTSGKAPLPIREVTVFKDGHAFVLAEGSMPIANGAVTLDALPNPVLGTFWPYAADSGVKIGSVTAGRRTIPGTRQVRSFTEMVRANIGKRATLVLDNNKEPYIGEILGAPAPDPANRNPYENIVLLKLDSGAIVVLSYSQIRELRIDGVSNILVDDPTQSPRLTLAVDGAKGGRANIGIAYLQKGLRWIPSYRVTLDGKGLAKVEMQATLVNELADLDNVTVNLVIGVPTFAFADTADPIGLTDTIAQLGTLFNPGSRMSNAIMGQGGARFGERNAYAGTAQPSTPPGPELTDAASSEDLFVYTLKNVRLKRGERMTLPVTTVSIPYKNVYTLELLPSPTRTAAGYFDASQMDAARAAAGGPPRAKHQIRLTNTSAFPLTTAPALLVRDGRVLAQGMMLYTARGATGDLPLTDATDITIKRTDKETGRTRNAINVDGNQYEKVELAGTVELCNFKSEPVEIEVVRYVLGKINTASGMGTISALDPLADDAIPGWLGAYGGYERIRFTGLGKVFWTATLPPGGKVCITLSYDWHYFTR